MAKTTRKTETTTGAIKPATRRKTAVEPAAAVEKATTRRRTKTSPEIAGPGPVETAASRPVKAERSVQAAPATEPTHAEIAIRAYHLYLRRRGWPGSSEHDWLQAVNELRRERGLR
jgi:hypothetical protein